jgi:hypothetical protein
MPEIPDDVKQQALEAAMSTKDSLNVDALPVKNASMSDVEQGPTTVPGQTLQPGANYNPAEPVPERESVDGPEK